VLSNVVFLCQTWIFSFLCRKTTLVNQIIKPLKERHGYLISGKFDLDGRSPDLVVFLAINAFFGTLLDGGDEETKLRLRARIADAVGEYGVDVLTKSIPNLGRLVAGQDCARVDLEAVSQQQLLHRSKYLVVKLIGAVADAGSPVALLFDDLQWADETSLDVLQMIATDPDVRYCLCVGCYRDDDCALTEKVTDVLDCIKHHVSVMAINLGKATRRAGGHESSTAVAVLTHPPFHLDARARHTQCPWAKSPSTR
jgi:predicted ATPase